MRGDDKIVFINYLNRELYLSAGFDISKHLKDGNIKNLLFSLLVKPDIYALNISQLIEFFECEEEYINVILKILRCENTPFIFTSHIPHLENFILSRQGLYDPFKEKYGFYFNSKCVDLIRKIEKIYASGVPMTDDIKSVLSNLYDRNMFSVADLPYLFKGYREKIINDPEVIESMQKVILKNPDFPMIRDAFVENGRILKFKQCDMGVLLTSVHDYKYASTWNKCIVYSGVLPSTYNESAIFQRPGYMAYDFPVYDMIVLRSFVKKIFSFSRDWVKYFLESFCDYYNSPCHNLLSTIYDSLVVHFYKNFTVQSGVPSSREAELKEQLHLKKARNYIIREIKNNISSRFIVDKDFFMCQSNVFSKLFDEMLFLGILPLYDVSALASFAKKPLMRKYYDIAISFSGEYRDFAHKSAILLRMAGYEVYFDDFFPGEFVGSKRDFFCKKFSDLAKVYLVVVGDAYFEGSFTKDEWNSITHTFKKSNGVRVICVDMGTCNEKYKKLIEKYIYIKYVGDLSDVIKKVVSVMHSLTGSR